MKKMSVAKLRNFILEEAAKINETLEQGKTDVESVNADETDASDLYSQHIARSGSPARRRGVRS